jgi:hypothetical protein
LIFKNHKLDIRCGDSEEGGVNIKSLELLQRLVNSRIEQRTDELLMPLDGVLQPPWAYAVPACFRSALDIAFTPRQVNKKTHWVWTQGGSFSFNEGYMIHGQRTIQVLESSPASSSKALVLSINLEGDSDGISIFPSREQAEVFASECLSPIKLFELEETIGKYRYRLTCRPQGTSLVGPFYGAAGLSSAVQDVPEEIVFQHFPDEEALHNWLHSVSGFPISLVGRKRDVKLRVITARDTGYVRYYYPLEGRNYLSEYEECSQDEFVQLLITGSQGRG